MNPAAGATENGASSRRLLRSMGGPVLPMAGIVIKELYRRKDFYVLFVLTVVLTLGAGTVNFFNESKVVAYIKDLCLLLIWVAALVIAIGTAARQIPAERESRTIFPLLAKPISRWQFILGKFLGCWVACGIALVVFYLFFGVVSASREHTWPVLHYWQALWLQWCMLGMVTALVLLGSVVFSAPSANATICFVVVFGILLLGGHLNKIALQQQEPVKSIAYTLYFLMPHMEWYDVRDLIIYDQPLLSLADMSLASAYAAVYTFLFLGVAWFIFRRKPLSL